MLARLRRTLAFRAYALLFGIHRGFVVGWILAAVAHGMLYPAIAYTGKEIADAVVARSTESVIRWVLVELVVVGVAGLLLRLATDMRMLLRGRVRHEIRLRVAHTASELSAEQLADPGVQDRIGSSRAAAETRLVALVNEMVGIVRTTSGLLVYALMVATFSPWALLFLLAIVPGAFAAVSRSRREARDNEERRRDMRRLRYLHDTLFNERLALENRICGMAETLLERSDALGQQVIDRDQAEWKRGLWVVLALQLLPTLVVNGTYLVMAVLTVRGELTLGELTLYGISLTSAQRLAQTLLLSTRTIFEAQGRLCGLFELLEMPKAAHTPTGPTVGDARSATGLRLENVSFRYPGAEAWALRAINLTIAPGDFVAIVGGNGDGKTTLVKLLTGELRPTDGRITLDGRALESWDADALRQRFAVMFQGFARYGLTVKDNVALGALGDADPMALSSALVESSAGEVIDGLPNGMDTELIASIPGGRELSGGQWQRLALARSLLQRGAEYVVLDEPTSALDASAEALVIKYLRARQAHSAIILITHRSSLLIPTDRIVTLEHGQVVRDRSPTHIPSESKALGAGA